MGADQGLLKCEGDEGGRGGEGRDREIERQRDRPRRKELTFSGFFGPQAPARRGAQGLAASMGSRRRSQSCERVKRTP